MSFRSFRVPKARPALRLAALALVGLLLPLPAAAGSDGAAAPPLPPALELVLAVDGSASITSGALEFQLRGHAAALRDPSVIDAVAASGGIAVTLVAFSGPRSLKVLVPWTVVRDGAAAEAFAARVLAAPRGFKADSTALGSAIDEAAALFADNGIEAPRRTIDIVSNGFCNAGGDPAAARDRAAAQGITVNALAILDEFPWLEDYYRENVIGGPSAFVHTAMDRETFVEALRRKLVMEIAGAGTALTRVAGLR
ncbi:DUF1194 domain-containing protein [Azospirillum sp. A39]|uniref:DUF1194 domain-containing protein n=1 Tax=Azospirillum sp. A39 TaxID=3462279 RepID=UPI0040463165